jgi:hypothetical protein
MRITPPHKIYISNSPIHGYGVFAGETIYSGEVIEETPIFDLGIEKGQMSSLMIDYRFNWPQGVEWDSQVLSWGYGSLYNHSEHPNAFWRSNMERNTFEFIAVKRIDINEEIFLWYGDENYWEDGRSNTKVINTLSEFYKNFPKISDKGTIHDYIDSYYNNIFTPKKNESIRLLEIGIYKGSSTSLFRSFFPKAEIIAFENNNEGGGLFEIEGVTIHWQDGYSDDSVDLYPNNYFDFIIDDGPHTLSSQILAVQKWGPKIKEDGKLIIEDIQSEFDLISILKAAEDEGFNTKVFDMRENKGRYDDIIIEITKS